MCRGKTPPADSPAQQRMMQRVVLSACYVINMNITFPRDRALPYTWSAAQGQLTLFLAPTTNFEIKRPWRRGLPWSRLEAPSHCHESCFITITILLVLRSVARRRGAHPALRAGRGLGHVWAQSAAEAPREHRHPVSSQRCTPAVIIKQGSEITKTCQRDTRVSRVERRAAPAPLETREEVNISSQPHAATKKGANQPQRRGIS